MNTQTPAVSASQALATIRRANLQAWMDKHKVNGSDLARMLGVQRSYTNLLFKPDRYFGEKAARSIERKLHLPDGYLDATGDKPQAVNNWATPVDLAPDALAQVLCVGLTEAEEQRPALIFKRDWLRQKRVTEQANLRVLTVHGDSMEGYLMDGDMAMIDMGQTQIHDNDVYAINYGGEIKLRRLSRRFDGGLLIRADNPKYPEETLSAEDAKLIAIRGRLVYRAG